ncbi:META domain-containing protein [Leifsonia sp. 22587]|uniref:META domain-containing protein n=1 Tax=Leifsonia sp. 22587 TaxID=3453946 RepID=UPI003F876AFF
MIRTRKLTVTLTVLVALSALALGGCSSAGSGFTGSWGSTATGQPHLTITADGSFSGSDGCNELSGTGTVSGDTFTFGPFASTLKACEGVNPWLSRAHTAKVSGDELVVYANGGQKVGTLAKK